ncbi:unnamed protein product [Adineta steineri]|uniref:Uncharacterized protein n=1 Tax=Adineta steineri TaxID=433720 RepID=A0A819TA68_9BILA|nr:unnamed protein product [Adineta steineri]
MHPKILFRWLYNKVCDYNLFMLEDNEYIDDDDEPEEPTTVLKKQKYTTWLYILFLMVSLYILFYIALIKPQSRTITEPYITPDIFNQLYIKYPTDLKCLCSNVTLSYETFVSQKITFHPVCSSIFVSEKWIKALYFLNASQYGAWDFRTIANSQFQLLAKFCLLSGQIVQQNRIDIDKNEFVTINLLSEEQVHTQVNTTVEYFKNSASFRIISFLNYYRTNTQADYHISALNTNLLIIASVFADSSDVKLWRSPITRYFGESPGGTCEKDNPMVTTTFVLYPREWFTIEMRQQLIQWHGFTYMQGFFAGCTPLEGLLESTLDCLYDIKCVELLIDYFPTLNQLNISLMDSILVPPKQNKSVYDHLSDLFIDEWSININYSKYYDECAPTSCTYTIIDQINFSDAFTLLISIYGGLIIIFRLIAPFLVNMSMKFNCCSRNRGVHLCMFPLELK